MLKVAKNTFREVDVLLFVASGVDRVGKEDRYILDMLKGIDVPVFLVINKIDQVHPDNLPKIIESYRKEFDFAEAIPISALEGNNVETLLAKINERLPEGPQYYPADQVTDHPERFIISELIREKALHLTREEIPHSIAVVIEKIAPDSENKDMIRVQAIIMVERDSQKGIVIGKKGVLLKQIGTRARQDIENLLGSKVYLELWVKVQKDWRNKAMHLRDFGFRDDEY